MSDSDENMSAISDEEEDPEIYDLKDLCVLIGSKKNTIDLLFDTGNFKKPQQCSKKSCRHHMNVNEDSSTADGCIWRCPGCRK